jgi:carboxypeptidase C (cathepsin A)
MRQPTSDRSALGPSPALWCARPGIRARWLALSLSVLLAACGGGGSSQPAAPPALPPAPPVGPGETAYNDPNSYSSAAGASLPGAEEAAAVTRHSLVLGGSRIDYTARAGHLIARAPGTGAAQASMFYVAYTADGAAPTTRPVTFFYNGGPGSASVWLHLGSFGPRRLATGVPATTAPQPFALVANAESLLDTTDLVFINAVGSGRSQAIAPFRNRDFWSVDADAAVFRDFIQRWLAVNGRTASPKFLFGESYGGPRTAVLARLLQDAGVMLAGLVLQAPAMDYNSNCGVMGGGNCSANLPTYGAIAAWHGLAASALADLEAYMELLRGFVAARYDPAVAAFLRGTPPPADLPALLAGYTGIGASRWATQFNLDPAAFADSLLVSSIIGRYDGRISAPRGSALAQEGDPSSTLIGASFATSINSYLRDTLRYENASTYVLLSGAIETWDFSHAGRALPDTVPDIAAALAQNPTLRVLVANGYHDLATPFRVTELDLARLGPDRRVVVRNYPGGHMTYLDDAARVRQKADLAAFYAGTQATALRDRNVPLSAAPAAAAPPKPDRAGVPVNTPQPMLPEPAIQTPHREPWVPPAQVQRALRERANSMPP